MRKSTLMPVKGRELRTKPGEPKRVVVRSTIDLDREIWVAMKMEAARAGETVRELLTAALKRELAARKRAR